MPKKISPLFILILIIPQITFASFNDVSSDHINADAIQYLQKTNVVKGSNGNFNPEQSVNRAEFVKMVYLAFGFPSDLEQEFFTNNVFDDVSLSDWFYQYVQLAAQLGLINGSGQRNFRPYDSVSSKEALKILYNFAYMANKDAITSIPITLNFPEFQASEWYAPYAQMAHNQGVMQINSSTINKTLTRAELAEMIYRLVLIRKTSVNKYNAALKNEIEFVVIPVTKSQKQDLMRLNEIISHLEGGYVNKAKLKEKNALEGSNYGLVMGLEDKYTQYLHKNEAVQIADSLMGTMIGYGFSPAAMKKNELEITRVVNDSPADLAGLAAGDIIISINGEDINEENYFDFLLELFSPKEIGDKIVLEVKEQGRGKAKKIELIAQEFFVPSVLGFLNEGIAYIQITKFQGSTAAEFEYVWETLGNREEIKGVIIDLRNNIGGYVDNTIWIADKFLDKDELITIINDGQYTEEKRARHKAEIDLPVICLVNNQSASASEILAAALQDNNKAILIGEKTFGKGSVQSQVILSGGSILQYTIAYWQTPKKKNINNLGIEPNINVTYSETDLRTGKDPVLEKAIEEMEDMIK